MLKKGNKVHLVGIQGVGMSALASMLVDMGMSVSGSDINVEYKTGSLLKKRGVEIATKFDKDNVKDKDIVIFSGSHSGSYNEEVKYAKQLGIKTVVMPEVLSQLSIDKDLLAVCGCHGKTTTTAICSFIALKLNINPSYYIGAPEFNKSSSGKYSFGKLFILEADEYVDDPRFTKPKPKLLYYSPKYIICTNLDFDHPDIYSDITEIKHVFASFFNRLKDNGFILINGDNQDLKTVIGITNKPIYSYGFNKDNDFIISENVGSFSISYQGKQISNLNYQIFGKHNMYNLAASVIFFYLYSPNKFRSVVKYANEFKGVSRRMELIYTSGRNLLYDDYAHHPNEIRAVLEGLKRKHPKHKIAVIYQPHTYSRTAVFEDEFISALKLADFIILLPIFGSMREADLNEKTNSKHLVTKAVKRGYKNFVFADSNIHIVDLIKKNLKKGGQWIYVTMGAGNVNDKHVIIKDAIKKQYETNNN